MRFNFPYIESGRRSPDTEAVLRDTWRAAFEAATGRGGRRSPSGRAGSRSAEDRLDVPRPTRTVPPGWLGLPRLSLAPTGQAGAHPGRAPRLGSTCRCSSSRERRTPSPHPTSSLAGREEARRPGDARPLRRRGPLLRGPRQVRSVDPREIGASLAPHAADVHQGTSLMPKSDASEEPAEPRVLPAPGGAAATVRGAHLGGAARLRRAPRRRREGVPLPRLRPHRASGHLAPRRDPARRSRGATPLAHGVLAEGAAPDRCLSRRRLPSDAGVRG